MLPANPLRRSPPAVAAMLIALLSLSAQAASVAEGEPLYQTHCAECHGADLRGSAHGNSLLGEGFTDRWRDGAALLAYVQAAMPPGSSNQLKPSQHAAIIAYVDQANGGALSGSSDATAGAAQWETWSAADTIDQAARARSGFQNRPTPPLPPVTDAMLANPDPGDWLSWRRSLDGSGYSPLKQIDRDNVSRLRLAWSLAMQDGSNQGTPLVYRGIMFLTHPGNMIQAIDAASGDVIWEYRYAFPEAARTLGGPTPQYRALRRQTVSRHLRCRHRRHRCADRAPGLAHGKGQLRTGLHPHRRPDHRQGYRAQWHQRLRAL